MKLWLVNEHLSLMTILFTVIIDIARSLAELFFNTFLIPLQFFARFTQSE